MDTEGLEMGGKVSKERQVYHQLHTGGPKLASLPPAQTVVGTPTLAFVL